MIHQLNMQGKDKVQVAIERLQMFEPPEGYYLAFSGGKDSVVIKALADMANVKYDAHFMHTSVEHPDLIRFTKDYHPDVSIEFPKDKDGNRVTMWNLIPRKKFPPTRQGRYCCEYLKENNGNGRFVITGVRWAESARRKNTRAGLEIDTGEKSRIRLDPDNPNNEKMARFCPTKGQHVINPVIDWETSDVWEFIHEYNIPYCKLYDEGYKRLGCIGCPMSTDRIKDLDTYPKFKQAYINAFDRMLQRCKEAGLNTSWKNAQEVFDWWVER